MTQRDMIHFGSVEPEAAVPIDGPSSVDVTVIDVGALKSALPLVARIAELESEKAATCEWTEDESDGSWDGACGEKWCLEDGTPANNNMNYCPGCGRHLVTIPTVAPVEED